MSARRSPDQHRSRRSRRLATPAALLALAAIAGSGASLAAAPTAEPAASAPSARLSNEDFLAQVGAEAATADDFGRRHLPLQFSGRLDESVAELVAYAERGGAARRFAVGNMLWAMAPAASLSLHRSADALQPRQPEILFELALHYTRNDDCAAALPLWAQLRAGPIGIPDQAAYIAAYCHLARGDLRGAVAIVRDSRVDSRHVGAEKLSYEVFGGPSELRLFDRDYRQAAGGDRVALERLLTRSFDWHGDWWNVAPQASAQDAAIALARTQWGPQQRERQEWECLWPKLRDRQQAFGYDDLARCGVIVGDRAGSAVPASNNPASTNPASTNPASSNPYPASSALGRVALGRAVARAAQPPDFAALLARHGDTLRERAGSEAGDLQALRVLAYLQQGAGDAAGLAASDELGWKRYREQAFARSRIERARPAADAPPDPAYRALLAQAAQDFPHDPLYPLLQAADGGGDPSAADLARILQAETRTLDLSERDGGLRSHSQLKALYRQLQQALEREPSRAGG